MLRHIALFRWKPEATAEDVSKIEAALRQLPAKIPCILSYRFGRDLHLAVLQRLIQPITAQRDAIQYVIEHSD